MGIQCHFYEFSPLSRTLEPNVHHISETSGYNKKDTLPAVILNNVERDLVNCEDILSIFLLFLTKYSFCRTQMK
jgi:hypothetical protein